MTQYRRNLIRDEMIKQHENGLNYTEIGLLLGYTKQYVRVVIKRYKLKKKSKK